MTKPQNSSFPVKQSLIDEITTVLQDVPIVKNLARKKFVSQFVIGLIQSRKIQFNEVAHHLNYKAKIASNEVRIQDFFRETEIDYMKVATLLLSLLPKKKKLRICIDRTEWDFGTCQINILVILVGYGDVHFPFYWELLDNNSGNSNAQDRIDLLTLCLNVLGKERIGLIVGDREFIGHKWLKYLKDNGLPFIMRVPKHHLLTDLDGLQESVVDLLSGTDKVIQLRDRMVDGVWGHVWLKAIDNGDFLFLFGTVSLEFMGQLYRKRWSIESCFQNLKGRGFDIESTHLKSFDKLKKLMALVSITYAFCVSLGVYLHRKVQRIKVKKHGYKSNSFSRHGLNYIRQLCREPTSACLDIPPEIKSLFTWLRLQLTHYQALKIVG